MNYNIFPALRPDRIDRKGLCPVAIFVYAGAKQVCKISTGVKVPAEQWDAEGRKVRKAGNALQLNSLIKKKIAELESKVLERKLSGGQDFADIFRPAQAPSQNDFFTFAGHQIHQKNYAPETKRRYRIFAKVLKEYRPALSIQDINFQFLQNYEAYLRDTKGNQHNTIWGHFKFLTTMVNDAIKSKLITANPFTEFKRLKYKQPKSTFLTGGEISKIEDFAGAGTDPGLTSAANWFLFMCYTGLRYSDAQAFNPSAHIQDAERIVLKTKKTGQEANLFITDKVWAILGRLKEDRLHISGQEFNRKLKVIAAACGINKKVSAHVARHTFGATLVDLGIDINVAQKLLAHGDIDSTKIYYHLKNKNMDDAMRKFNQ